MLLPLFYVFLVIVTFQLLYYLFVFSSFAFTKKQQNNTASPPISVIICAKNEAENLKVFLPKIISQDYSNFEIVLINDASYDETLEVMESFAAQHNRIKIVNVENNEAFWGNKKYALTLGIKAAKNKHLLFTDADCYPKSNSWISLMASHFSSEKTIVLGFGAYEKEKGSIVNLLVRFETFITALHYFSFAKIGLPYMGVGRNLAYHSNEFFNVNGYMSHMKIRSGDDDLFINQVANKNNTSICITEDSHTVSKAPSSFLAWIKQKRRHISTANHYKFKHQFLLALDYILKVGFWSLSIILLCFLFQWQIVVAVIATKLIIQYIIYASAAKKLQQTNVILALPLFEVFLILFQFGIFIANTIAKPKHWK